tara:strand:+ start:2359 stop:2682 length:324 start_codon:yes stop_codon:yes gene_type:complete
MAGKLSDLVPDYCTHPDELVGQVELRGQQTEDDARVTARLPGDEVEDHLFHSGANPFLRKTPAELRALLEGGELSVEDERLVRKARALLQVQHSDMPNEGGGFRPPH